MKKRFNVLILTLISVIVLSACGSNAGDSSNKANGGSTNSSNSNAGNTASSGEATGGEFPTLNATLEYWSSWNPTEPQAEIITEAAAEFMKLNPAVKINLTFNGRDNSKILVSAIESGQSIQMFDANADNVMALWREWLHPLSSYFDEVYPTTNGKSYSESTIQAFSSLARTLGEGEIYYVPYTPQGFMWFYNKDIFAAAGVEAVPTTWEEFLAVCEKIKQAGYTPIITDSKYSESLLGYLLSRLKGNDWVIELVNDTTKEKWNDPAVLTALQMVEELYQRGYFAKSVATNILPAGQQEMVIEEKVAMYLNGTWLPNEVKDTARPDFNWGQFAFPDVKGGVEDRTHGAFSSYGIAVNKEATEEQALAAFSFAVYLTTGEWDQAFAKRASAIPMSETAEWAPALLEAKEVFASIQHRYPSQTAIKVNTDIQPFIQSNFINLISGQITAEQFIEKMTK